MNPVVYLDDGAIVRHLPHVRTVLICCRVPEHEVPDLTQTVIEIAWTQMMAGEFRPPPDMPLAKAVERWLFGIAWRVGRNYFRQRHVRREIPYGTAWDLEFDPGPSPEGQAMAHEITRALRRIPRIFRDVLALVAVGATTEEIAAVMKVPITTINGRIRVGRERLKKALARG